MIVVACLFIALVVVRCSLYLVDDGFGGGVWTGIMYVSSLAWLLGVILSLYVVGIRVEIGVPW